MTIGLNPIRVENGKRVSSTWIANIPNDENAESTIGSIRALIKMVKGPRYGLRVRGRHSDRKGLFKKIGRHYNNMMASGNDFRKSEFKHCEYFALYLRDYDPYADERNK